MTESRVGKRPGIHNFFSSGIAQGGRASSNDFYCLIFSQFGNRPPRAFENEVPWILFLGFWLDFHYFLTGVVFPKFGFYLSRGVVAQALVEP